MEDARQQLVEKLKTANNILVTVSRNPSVDQLSALLGLALLLNKQGKHAAAVFSGEVPSTLEFLKPEDTFEKTTDSLRDFIIALDKNKADKLRYKVEDNFVRIFITPYKTSITQDDLEFSQGDFNVDLVIALGVTQQEDIDQAIVAHGRILHDATLASINTVADGAMGTINWHSPGVSSLCELVTSLAQDLEGAVIDEQIATALLTGIVAETDRFSNEKTAAATMSVSAVLMGAGANQQLVASKLENTLEVQGSDNSEENQPQDDPPAEQSNDDGSLAIDHSQDKPAAEDQSEEKPTDDQPAEDEIDLPNPEESQVEEPQESSSEEKADDQPTDDNPHIMTEPPTLGGTLTANSSLPEPDPVTDPLSMPAEDESKLLDRKAPPAFNESAAESTAQPETAATETPEAAKEPEIPEFVPPPDSWHPEDGVTAPQSSSQSQADNTQVTDAAQNDDQPQADSNQTLTEIEESVQSPHLDPDHLDDARDEVSRALAESQPTPEPIQALNAQPMDMELHAEETQATPEPPTAPLPPAPAAPAAPFDPLAPFNPAANPVPADNGQETNSPQVIDPNAPPPVPPPLPFQFNGAPPQDRQ